MEIAFLNSKEDIHTIRRSNASGSSTGGHFKLALQKLEWSFKDIAWNYWNAWKQVSDSDVIL